MSTTDPIYPDNQIGTGTFDVALGNSPQSQILLNDNVTVNSLVFTHGQLGGRNNLTLLDEGSRWTGGTMGGPGTTVISEEATLDVTGPAILGIDNTVLARPLINNGFLRLRPPTSDVSRYAVYINGGGSISNKEVATVEVSGDLNIAGGFSTASGVINNFGEFRTANGSTNVAVTFNNSGAVTVQSGTLDLSWGESTGRFDIATGATLSLRGHTLDGARLLNEGVLHLGHGASTSFLPFRKVPTEIASEQLIPGSAVVDGDILMHADLHVVDLLWRGGTLNGEGRLVIEADGALQFGTTCQGLCSPIRPVMEGTSVINKGMTQFTRVAELVGTDGAEFTNAEGGVLLLKDDTNLIRPSGRATFVNQGVFEKEGGGGAAQVQWQFSNSGTLNARRGVIDFHGGIAQSDGTINLMGGDIRVSVGELHINGGRLKGSGTITGRVANLAGTISPGTGVGRIAVQGDYRQGKDASFSVDVDRVDEARENSDRLDIMGHATLDGFIEIDASDGFIPTVGSQYEILTATDGVDGIFSEDKLSAIAPGLGWKVTYESNRVLAVVTELEIPGWTNADNPFDVNGDSIVTPIDVLHVINELNNRQYSEPDGLLLDPSRFPDHAFIDVTSDGFVTPRDALLTINEINSASSEASIVPEPSALPLLLVCICGFIRHGRILSEASSKDHGSAAL